MGHWDIYDELIRGIDKTITISSVVCGHTWTVVRNDAGNLGMAMTTPGETRNRTKTEYTGVPLFQVAECVKSWNLPEAGIGMAAINSYYNTAERLIKMHAEQKDDSYCTFGLDLKGKDVVMVGHMRYDQKLFSETSSLSIIEMNPQDGDFPSGAAEYLIPNCDILLVTGSAFINKTMPRILELGENAYTVLTGPSVPMSEALIKNHNIQRLTGFIPGDNDMIQEFVSAGCFKSPYGMGRRFCLEGCQL